MQFRRLLGAAKRPFFGVSAALVNSVNSDVPTVDTSERLIPAIIYIIY
jgi:hypothetical protein